MNFLLPYGKQGIEVCLPDKNAHILTPPDLQDLSDADPTLAKLESPLGSPPFEEMAEGKKTALIAMADHHRFGTYQKEILNQVLGHLHHAHLSKIRILVARGTHPPATRKEWEEMYGGEDTRVEANSLQSGVPDIPPSCLPTRRPFTFIPRVSLGITKIILSERES